MTMRLFHAPQTRSTRILWLLEELGARRAVDVTTVSIARSDGSCAADPANPHPDGKVPALDTGAAVMTESAAIVCFLADYFPAAKLAPAPGTPLRAAYLNWLHYYGGVMEPVMTVHVSAMEPDALFTGTFRGYPQLSDRLTAALEDQEYILESGFSAADLLMAAPFIWFPAMAPDSTPVRRWIERCASRLAFRKASAEDAALLGQ